MPYFLDTNVVTQLLKRNPRLVERYRNALERGEQVYLSAVVYYELKRELLRAKKSHGLNRLDSFVNAAPGRYLPLSDEALRLAAELWARSRQEGRPTAESTALDIDVLIAAQVLSFGAAASEVTVVTMNPKHLSRFTTAKYWNQILE